jgi:hypothetical protein
MATFRAAAEPGLTRVEVTVTQGIDPPSPSMPIDTVDICALDAALTRLAFSIRTRPAWSSFFGGMTIEDGGHAQLDRHHQARVGGGEGVVVS